MKKTIFFALSFLLGFQFSYAQQEPHYTQNQFNSNLLLNPAYAGSGPCSSLGVRYRNQWTGFEGAPTTFSFIGDTRVASDRLGLGVTCNYDKIGIERILTPDVNVAYHLPVNDKGKFSMGLDGGASFVTSDFTKLSGVSPDPLYGGNKHVTLPFVGLGVLYYTDLSYIGLSVPTLVSFGNTPGRADIPKRHFYLYGGYRFVFDNGLDLRPALMARYEAQAPLQFDLATDLWYKDFIGFGVAYRTGDAVAYMVKGKIKKMYLGYSYDMTVSGLSGFNNGTHEIFLGYEICNTKSKLYPRTDNIRHF